VSIIRHHARNLCSQSETVIKLIFVMSIINESVNAGYVFPDMSKIKTK